MTKFDDICRPDCNVCIQDDVLAESILNELNLLEKLRSHDALSYPCLGAACVHRSHIIGVLWYRGYAKPEDNGFILHICPRTLMNKDQMMKTIKKTIAQNSAENMPPWIELD